LKGNKNLVMKRCLTLSVMLIYLLVVSTHIFCLPRITYKTPHSHNSIFKRKVENIQSCNGLSRIDKAVFKQSTKCVILSSVRSFPILILKDCKIKNLSNKIFELNSRSFCNNRYSYISLSVFRI
jgi:hypothetical protein